MIPRLLGIATVSFGLALCASAAPKIALVRVKDIYTEQPATKAAQDKARKAKEALLLDPRAEELREGIEALRKLQKKISNPNQKPTTEEGRVLAREFEKKRLETSAIQEDFEKFRTSREKEINTEMVAEMRSILNRIVTLSEQTAREKGFDLAIDSSGSTNTGAPFILYARNAPDITGDVIEKLKKEQPSPATGNKPSPAPSTP